MATEITPRQAVYAYLRASPEIQALVGDRIYHQTPPLDATYPLIVLNTISNVDRRDLSAVAYSETRIQITAMANDPPNTPGGSLKDAEKIAMAVRKSLEGFQGLMAGALQVIDCQVVSYLPIYQDGMGQTHYHVDVLITHKGGI